MSMSNVCLQGKKERDVRVLSLPRTRNLLVAKTEVIAPKNYVLFSQRTSIWRYKMKLTDSILSTLINPAFSIFLDVKTSGVTLFSGMAD